MQPTQFINKQAIVNNVKHNAQEKANELKLCVKHVLPYAIAGTIFYGLSEQALLQPANTVAWAVSKVLDGGTLALMAKCCFNLWKIANNEYDMNSRKVTFVATQQDVDFLNGEINRLKQELDYMHRKYSPNYTTNYTPHSSLAFQGENVVMYNQ